MMVIVAYGNFRLCGLPSGKVCTQEETRQVHVVKQDTGSARFKKIKRYPIPWDVGL